MVDSPIKTKHLRAQRFRNAQQAWKGLRRKFRNYEDENLMTYRKVLGFGGFGLVQKWGLKGADKKGRERTAAVKTIIRPDHPNCIMSLQREIWWAKRFAGCEHLVQLVDLPQEVLAGMGANINNEECPGVPIMAMEELGQGSLAQLMDRIFHMHDLNPELPLELRMMEYIPNRILWSIFLCLTRACIGMAYASVYRQSEKGISVRETMQCIPDDLPASKIIHSDIDVQNVFIAEPDGTEDDEHRLHPIVKIADYGCMVEWDETWSYQKRKASLWGKHAYKAPEQFDANGDLDVHTNIYQIGHVIHDLITLGFVSFRHRIALPRRMVGGNLEFRTYGCRLMESQDYKIQADWKNVDGGLRELAAGCMAEDPTLRPTLRQLEEVITFRIRELNELVKDANAVAPDLTYQFRVPQGQAEHDSIVERFYREYFVESWDDTDKYSSYWADRTLMPSSSGAGSTAVPQNLSVIQPGAPLSSQQLPSLVPDLESSSSSHKQHPPSSDLILFSGRAGGV